MTPQAQKRIGLIKTDEKPTGRKLFVLFTGSKPQQPQPPVMSAHISGTACSAERGLNEVPMFV